MKLKKLWNRIQFTIKYDVYPSFKLTFLVVIFILSFYYDEKVLLLFSVVLVFVASNRGERKFLFLLIPVLSIYFYFRIGEYKKGLITSKSDIIGATLVGEVKPYPKKVACFVKAELKNVAITKNGKVRTISNVVIVKVPYKEEIFPNDKIVIKNITNVYKYKDRLFIQVWKEENFLVRHYTGEDLFIFLYRIRKALISRIDRSLPPIQAKLLQGLLFGSKEELGEEWKSFFLKSGTIHILAASGLHAGFIYLFFYYALFFVKENIRILLSAFGLWWYVFLLGFSPSIIRASMMISIFALIKAVNRKTPAVNILFLSMNISLIISPMDIFSVGFLLSYGATLGILILYKRINYILSPLRCVGNGLAVSISAFVFTVPITIFFFKQFPAIQLVANLLIPPLVGFIMLFGIATILFPYVAIIKDTTTLLLSLVLHLSKFFSQYFFSYNASINLQSIISYIVLIFGIFFFSVFRKSTKKVIPIMLIFSGYLLFSLSFFHKKEDGLHLTVCSYKNGFSLFLYKFSKAIVIDTANFGCMKDTGFFLYNELLKRGIMEIERLIFTTPLNESFGGGSFLIRFIKVNKVILPETLYFSFPIRRIIEIAEQRKVKIFSAREQKFFTFFGCKIRLIYPNNFLVNDSKGYKKLVFSNANIWGLYCPKKSLLLLGLANKYAIYNLQRQKINFDYNVIVGKDEVKKIQGVKYDEYIAISYRKKCIDIW